MLVTGPVEKARHYIESHEEKTDFIKEKKRVATAGPCITISRESGAGVHTVSVKLMEYLGKFHTNTKKPWAVFDRNLIEKVLQDHHLPKRLSKLMGEEKYSGIVSMMNEIFAGQPGIFSLVHKTSETILQLAQIGNCIIVDRAGNIITANMNNAFHVRLVSPLENRMQHIMDVLKMNKKEALDYIKKEDEDRKEYVMTYFHKDVNDPHLYDIILNTQLISDDDTAKIIGNAVMNKFPEYFQIGD